MSDAVQASPLAGTLLADNPLSATHRRELAAARERAKAIRKAARVAGFNGWTTAAAAAFSAMFLLFDRSPVAIAITLGLSIITYNEFRGRKRLLNFDASAATMLGWNQLGLLAMIVVYCLWSLLGSAGEADAVRAELKSYSDLDAALGAAGGFEGMFKTVSYGLYGGVIVLSVIFQGGNALYYFTRRRHVEDFIAETPQWVRDVQGGSVPV
ncbi:MAG TPA: hypothetical protein VKH44_02960 [Pirellulaceae bacterium]|nr:hypothetical protein [Pirellulaceae bacterium]